MDPDRSNLIELTDGESFDPLPLATDDLVPTSMLLILVYPYSVDPLMLARGLRAGLKSFPHLSGEISGSVAPMGLEIRPSGKGLYLEILQHQEDLDQPTIEAMPLDELGKRFAPSWAHNYRWKNASDDTPLFHAQLTTFKRRKLSVLGLFASHMAIDGTGLLLLLSHAAACVHGIRPPSVFHDRRALEIADAKPTIALPPRYRTFSSDSDVLLSQWDEIDAFPLGIFTVSVESICHQFGVDSLKDARLTLTSMLCMSLNDHSGEIKEVALWCDPRGTAGIPKTYTGNTGCYVHLPIHRDDGSDLLQRLHGMRTRKGFGLITETYRAIKAAESQGKVVVWEGLDSGVVPVNLVPYSRGGTDWGAGPPVFGQMLTRNSHGLRIWTSPDGKRFLVESCLPRSLTERLIDRCIELDVILSHRIEIG